MLFLTGPREAAMCVDPRRGDDIFHHWGFFRIQMASIRAVRQPHTFRFHRPVNRMPSLEHKLAMRGRHRETTTAEQVAAGGFTTGIRPPPKQLKLDIRQ